MLIQLNDKANTPIRLFKQSDLMDLQMDGDDIIKLDFIQGYAQRRLKLKYNSQHAALSDYKNLKIIYGTDIIIKLADAAKDIKSGKSIEDISKNPGVGAI